MKRLNMLEPIGALMAKDVPPELRAAVSNKRSGCFGGDYAMVWRNESGATLIEELVDLSKLIKGKEASEIWEEQLSAFGE